MIGKFGGITPWDQMRIADLMLAFTMIGTPYLYGGQSREGCDCSGFQVYRYRKQRILKPREDYSCQGFWNLLGEYGMTRERKPGNLVFYGQSFIEIEHMALIVAPETTIDAPGGGSRITVPTEGIFFDLHPITRRGREDILGYADPFIWLKRMDNQR